MGKFNEENNFHYLTAALLVLLLALPLLTVFRQGPVEWMTQILIIATLVVAYLSLDFGRWWGRFVLLVLFLLITGSIVHLIYPTYSASAAHLVLLLLFFGSVAYSAGRRVLLRGDIDGNRIIGSIAVYLLLGLVWAMLYLLLLEFAPGAIQGIEDQRWENNFSDILYFSFVTLTTLGYGDITPVHPASSALAYLQAITGAFYMAVVVASLIGAKAPARLRRG
jgi:voltage-gated potassium channel